MHADVCIHLSGKKKEEDHSLRSGLLLPFITSVAATANGSIGPSPHALAQYCASRTAANIITSTVTIIPATYSVLYQSVMRIAMNISMWPGEDRTWQGCSGERSS